MVDADAVRVEEREESHARWDRGEVVQLQKEVRVRDGR